MKAARVAGPSRISVCDAPDVSPGPGEILVRMEACGICGSDLEKVFGRYGQPSMRLGHEPAGTVVAVGEPADDAGSGRAKGAGNGSGLDGGLCKGRIPPAARLEVGDRVFTHHHVPCHSCHLCLHGRETMCPVYYKTNLSPCGLSEQYVVPAWNVSHGGVLKISDSTSFAEAAMIEPLACCVRAWRRVSHRPGDTVAVFGVGPTGVMHAMLSAMHGSARTICLDINDYRLQFAREVVAGVGSSDLIRSDHDARRDALYERTGGLGADVSIVATSSLAALGDAIATTRRGGTVVMFGVPTKGAVMEVDMADVYSREITLTTSYAASDVDTADALRLIESGKIDAGRLITHMYRLSDSQEAFERARAGRGAMKIVITRD